MLLKSITALVMLCACSIFADNAPARGRDDSPPSYSEMNTPSSQTRSNVPVYNLHDEDDKTDIFAIPSDSSEEELNEQMDELDALQRPSQK